MIPKWSEGIFLVLQICLTLRVPSPSKSYSSPSTLNLGFSEFLPHTHALQCSFFTLVLFSLHTLWRDVIYSWDLDYHLSDISLTLIFLVLTVIWIFSSLSFVDFPISVHVTVEQTQVAPLPVMGRFSVLPLSTYYPT